MKTIVGEASDGRLGFLEASLMRSRLDDISATRPCLGRA